MAVLELVHTKHDDGANDGGGKEVERKPRQLPLQRSADVDTDNLSNPIDTGHKPRLDVGENRGGAVFVALDGTGLLALLAKSGGDHTDFRNHTRGDDDTLGAALGDDGRGVGDVEAVTGAGVLVENIGSGLADGKRFTGEQSLVGFKVHSLDQSGKSLVLAVLHAHARRTHLTSAGIVSPVFITTMSPGTTSDVSTET